MNTAVPPPPSAPSPSSLPGAHPDDDSVAGEEDPGASIDEVIAPSEQPAPRPPDRLRPDRSAAAIATGM